MFNTAPARTVEPCSFGRWINTLETADQTNLQRWLDADWLTNSEMRRLIATEANKGFDRDTIRDHRKGVCRCSKLK